ncbi:oligosaccharide flippase family protein [Roseovarius amoyensis]|uniref:oligosaccharide flippase family protein n=1 Tax=Roseovarius amoyensis TaxID=2211448 RepID=UPI0013A69CCD|nr:oligosaccharide flippase family protein [Roseovarius amoyensis]
MTLTRGISTSLGRMVLRGTARLIGGRVARTIVTLAGIAVLARLLTPGDFGVVAVAAMILPLSRALLDGLIDVPTIREDALDQEGLANLIWVGVTLMTGLAVLLWLAAPGLAVLLNSSRLDDVLRVLCFGLLLQPFIASSHALLRREHRFGLSALFMPVAGAAYVLTAIALALLDFGVWSLILGQIASLAITAAGLGLISGIPIRPPRQFRIGAAWRLGGLGLATRLLAWMSANVDTLFASAMLGAAGAGFYSRAYNITTQLKEPFSALDQTVRQAFVAQRSLDDAAAARATLGGLRLVVLAAAMVSAAVIVLRDPIVALLLGSQWGAVVLPLAILAASLPARVARLYLDGFTYARGSMRHMLVRNIAIVGLLAGGLWLWAGEGIVAIALVVAAMHVGTLFFRGGAVDIAVAGGMGQRLAAMAPGYATGAALVALGEMPGLIWPGAADMIDWSVRVAVCALCYLCVVLAVPGRWLPRSIAEWRRRRSPLR